MATKLEKDLVRESTIKVNDREILITITADQGVTLKLKGMKSGILNIPIGELYEHLSGEPIDGGLKEAVREPKPIKGDKKISLHELRTKNAISGLDYETMAKFDGIIKAVLEE